MPTIHAVNLDPNHMKTKPTITFNHIPITMQPSYTQVVNIKKPYPTKADGL
jgi:hypothetical protein